MRTPEGRPVWGLSHRALVSLLRHGAVGPCVRPERDTARAMSQENVEVVRRAYEAFTGGGVEAAEEFLHPEVVWEDRYDMPGASVYRGHDGFRIAVDRFYEVWAELSISAEQVIDVGNKVVVAHRWRGRGKEGGTPIDTVDWNVLTIESGLITRRQAFSERADALEAAGLRE